MAFVIHSFVILIQLNYLNALTCTIDEIFDYVNSETIPWPKCSCESHDYSAATEEDVIYSTYFLKKCWSCHCGQDERGKYHSCTVESNEVDSAQNWNLFECPRSTLCVDDNGAAHYAHTGWFAETDGECSKYCYCTGEGSIVCEEGWSNIMSSSNDELIDSFMDQCKYNLFDCIDDPSRWFTTDFGSQCSLCPKCNCGSYGVDSEWFTEHEALWDYSKIHCSHCKCMDDKYNYANCTHVDTYVEGNGQCPPPSSLSCHHMTMDGLDTMSSVSSGSCSTQTPTQWCAWTESTDEYSWGCGNVALNMWCEAYGAEDSCMQYTIPKTSQCEYDVDSGTNTKHLYCCREDDNCNFVTADTSSCSVSTALSSAMNDYYECLYGNRKYDQYFCDTGNTTVTCQGISELYGLTNECSCIYFADVYSRVGAEWKIFLEDEMNQYLTEASEWNDVLGCGIDFKCDLSTGILTSTQLSNENKAFSNKYMLASGVFTFITMICLH